MRATASSSSSKSSSYWQQTLQNRMLTVIMAMVVIVPLLASPSVPRMQAVANHALIVMAALAAGILVMRGRVASNWSEVKAFLATGANLAVLLYFAWSIVTLFVGSRAIAASLGRSEIIRILTGILLYFALAYHVRRSEHLVKILDSLVLVAALMAVAGMAVSGLEGRGRNSLLGDHQLYGAFLMLLFPVALVAALTERDQKRQIAAQVAAALTGVGLLLSGTRTAWFGAIVEMAALLVLSFIGTNNKNKAAERKHQYIVPLLIVLTCGGLFVGLGGANRIFGARLNEESVQSSLDYRRHMWYAAEQLTIRNPLWGNGLGSFPILQYPYSRYGRPGNQFLTRPPDLSEMAHNFWYQTTAEQGLIGAALFAGIILTFLITGIRRLTRMDTGIRRSLLLACLAAVLGFCVDAFGNPAWQFAQVSMFFWLILGLGVSCLRPRTMRQEG